MNICVPMSALAPEVARTVNILQAVMWIAEAWKQVSGEAIKKRFRKAGIHLE